MPMNRARGHRWPWLLVLLPVLAALVAWFPANWAWAWLAPRYPAVHVAAVHGSVWNGRADGVLFAAEPLGTVRWTLDRSALWGRLHLSASVDGRWLTADGNAQRDNDGNLSGDDLHFRMSAAQLPSIAFGRGVQPQGELEGTLDHWRLRHGWPVQLDGTVVWHDAALRAGARGVALGTFQADLSAVAGTTLKADLHDVDGSPVALRGTLRATLLGWRLDARLMPRVDDPRTSAILQRLGTPDGAGGVRVHRQAGLMWGAAP
jgi:general secretion pathway protein N